MMPNVDKFFELNSSLADVNFFGEVSDFFRPFDIEIASYMSAEAMSKPVPFL